MSAFNSANWREWISRYGWAEFWGLITSYLGYFAGAELMGLAISGAFASSLGENVGYYGCIIWREISLRLAAGERLSSGMIARTAGDLLYEFGLPETVDFLIVRPATTLGAVTLLGPGAGVFVGKVLADIIFYVLTISLYRHRKRTRSNRSETAE